jgi:hypothetical protein
MLATAPTPGHGASRRDRTSKRRSPHPYRFWLTRLPHPTFPLPLHPAAERLSFSEALDWLRESISAVADPDVEDLLAILPPWESFADPEGSNSGAPRKGGTLTQPTATVILGWEGTLVDSTYHPKAGRIAVPRPGFSYLLLALADAGVEVVLWSRDLSSNVLQEQFQQLLEHDIIPEDKDRYNAFVSFLEQNYKVAVGVEHAQAMKEGREPKPLQPLFDNDKPQLYVSTVLRIAAQLGREQSFVQGKEVLRPVDVLTRGRDTHSVLVIDSDPGLKVAFPDNTLLIAPWPVQAKEGGDATTASSARAAAREATAMDPTLHLLGEMLERYSAAVQAAKQKKESKEQKDKVTIQSFLRGLKDIAQSKNMMPNTGSALDESVGVLGVVLRDVRAAAARRKKEQEASATKAK